MAGQFVLLFSVDFTSTASITVTHSLDRLQVAAIVRIGDVARNDLITTVTPLDTDPRNAVVVTLDSAQTGTILIVDTDYVFANIPSSENAGVLSGGTAMTADVYDPTTVAADVFARGNHTGTQVASTISDFDTEVANNATVTTNTAHLADMANPHTTDVGNLGSGTLAELNTVITDATLDDASSSRTPLSHAASHQNGGGDEVSVTGLSGLLADGQTPLSHAASHQHGGGDEVATATPAANAIPKADGTGLLDAWVTPSVFGEAYQSDTDMTFRSTSGTAFFEVHSITTPSLTAGTYRVEWLYIWSHNANGNDYECRVQVDNMTNLYEQTDGGGGAFDEHRQEPKDSGGSGDGGTNQRHVTSGWADVVLAAAAHTIDIDISTSNAGTASSVHRTQLAVWRVA